MPINERKAVQVGDIAATHALSGSVKRPVEREVSNALPRASQVSDDMLGITYVSHNTHDRDNDLPLGIEMDVRIANSRSNEAFIPILEPFSKGIVKYLHKLNRIDEF